MKITLTLHQGADHRTLYVDDNGGYSFEGKLDKLDDDMVDLIGEFIKRSASCTGDRGQS